MKFLGANFVPLSPISFFNRTTLIRPNKIAYIYEDTERSWRDVQSRVHQIADALVNIAGVKKGDTVAVMAMNLPESFELHLLVLVLVRSLTL